MAPGDLEPTPPNAPPSSQPDKMASFNQVFSGTVFERPVQATPEMDSLFSTYSIPSQMTTPYVTSPFSTTPLATGLSHTSTFAYPSATVPSASSSVSATPAPPLQLQQHNLPQSELTLSDNSDGLISLTVLGGGTGPAHTIPIMPSYGQPQQPTLAQATSTQTTHKRALIDSPIMERQESADRAFAGRRSVLGGAFTGEIVEREPFPPPKQTDDDASTQPPKKMSRFRAMRGGEGNPTQDD